MPKCRQCKTETTQKYGLFYLCSPQCGFEYSKRAQDKARAKKEAQSKREHRQKKEALKTRSEWMREAQTEFNKFVRMRDKDLPCISCGRFHQGQYHAGHYLSVGAHPELRFEELNVWRQCMPCNAHLSGNLVNYRINLIQKIGLEKVEWLEGPHEPLKLTIEQIKEIKANYRQKQKELK